MELPYDPAISLLGIYPKDFKQVFKQKLAHRYPQQNYSQSAKDENKSPSTNEGINRMPHSYVMEQYSAIKRNEEVRHAAT